MLLSLLHKIVKGVLLPIVILFLAVKTDMGFSQSRSERYYSPEPTANTIFVGNYGHTNAEASNQIVRHTNNEVTIASAQILRPFGIQTPDGLTLFQTFRANPNTTQKEKWASLTLQKTASRFIATGEAGYAIDISLSSDSTLSSTTGSGSIKATDFATSVPKTSWFLKAIDPNNLYGQLEFSVLVKIPLLTNTPLGIYGGKYSVIITYN